MRGRVPRAVIREAAESIPLWLQAGVTLPCSTGHLTVDLFVPSPDSLATVCPPRGSGLWSQHSPLAVAPAFWSQPGISPRLNRGEYARLPGGLRQHLASTPWSRCHQRSRVESRSLQCLAVSLTTQTEVKTFRHVAGSPQPGSRGPADRTLPGVSCCSLARSAWRAQRGPFFCLSGSTQKQAQPGPLGILEVAL